MAVEDRFIITLQGKDYILYAGLIQEATAQGLWSIETEVIQYPTDENGNNAIAKATATTKDGRKFVEFADASPKNVGKAIVNAVLRMALTRSKARALRDLTSIGITAFEELDMEQYVAELTKKNSSPKVAEEDNFSPEERATEVQKKSLITASTSLKSLGVDVELIFDESMTQQDAKNLLAIYRAKYKQINDIIRANKRPGPEDLVLAA